MRVYTAPPVPAHRPSGRPLNASSLGRGQSSSFCPVRLPSRPSADRRGFQPIGPTICGAVVRFRSDASPPPGVVPARSAVIYLADPARPPSRRRPSPLSACGLTRRCSGPAVPAGLHCSPGSSPPSVWPAAERFFVRPHQPGGWPFALTLLVGLHPAGAPQPPCRSSRCVLRRRFHLAALSLTRPAAPPVRRVRPNQALQRTGSVCGFTVRSPDLSPSWVRPAAEYFFLKTTLKRATTTMLTFLLLASVACSRVPSVSSTMSPQDSQKLAAAFDRLDLILQAKAPTQYARLAGGATTAEIAKLRLSLDGSVVEVLEKWFAWHNGASAKECTLLPLGHLLSIDESLADRQMEESIPFIGGLRKRSIKILDDGAGDGFFLDVTSTNPLVFYHMLEDPHPRYYGTMAEFVDFIADGFETGVFSEKPSGDFNYDEAQYVTLESAHLATATTP